MQVRVYQLAKELGRSSKDLIDALAELGIDVKNHMSRLAHAEVRLVREGLAPRRRPKPAAPPRVPPVAPRRPAPRLRQSERWKLFIGHLARLPADMQSALIYKRMLFIGLGSMGGPVLCHLVRQGHGWGGSKQLLVDPDAVEDRNTLHAPLMPRHCGMKKVDALASIAREICPTGELNLELSSVAASTDDPEHMERLVRFGREADLIGLFALEGPQATRELSERLYAHTPMLTARFLEGGAAGEVAFSLPGQTPPLHETLLAEANTGEYIAQPTTTDFRTSRVTSDVAEVAERLLVGPDVARDHLRQIYIDEPVFRVGGGDSLDGPETSPRLTLEGGSDESAPARSSRRW